MAKYILMVQIENYHGGMDDIWEDMNRDSFMRGVDKSDIDAIKAALSIGIENKTAIQGRYRIVEMVTALRTELTAVAIIEEGE
jgi:hypothetical protein